MPIANEYAEELPRKRFSRDAENQLDKQVERAENEDEAETPEEIENGIFQITPKAQAAFEKHLSDEDRKLAKETIAKQIGENVKDFNSLADPVEFDAAFSKLPAVKKIRVDFNMNRTQRDESLKNRCAVSYEYARRCFLNDPRVKAVIVHAIYSNRKQSGVEISLRQGTSGRTGRKGNSVQSINSGTFATPGLGEFSKIHKQFTDLIGEKHSRDVSAFSFGENPLSEQPLKAKAELETPLGKLEKASSQIIEEIVADAMSSFESAEQIMRAIERCSHDMNVSLWSKNGSSEAPRHHRQPAAPMICQNGSGEAPRHHRQPAAPMVRQPSQPFWQVSFP